MATLNTRITILEQRAQIDDNVVFFAVHSDDAGVPAQGWFFNWDGERMDILRLPDETDDALRVRAAAACRAANCPMVLFEIDEHWINHGGLFVPTPMTAEAWEAAAVKQQTELTRDVANGE